MDDELDLDLWLESGTVNRKTVTLYNDPAAIGKMQALLEEEELIKAEIAKAGGDKSLADTNALDKVTKAMERLEREFGKSKAEWVLAPVSADDEDEIRARFPEPVPPRKPAVSADKAEWAEYDAALAEWRAATAANVLSTDIAFIATSVVEVRAGGKVRHGVTPDQVRALRGRPHGKTQYQQLLAGAIEVTRGEVALPLPKSVTS